MMRLRAAVVLAVLVAAPNPVWAQTATAGRWEIEAHGGLAITRLPAGGTVTLPRPGPAITTSSPIFPSRQVSSWFFGDGASLLNGVNAEFDIPQRLTPVESLFDAIGRASTSGAAFGVRLRRTLRPRWSAEVSLDVMTGSAALTGDVRDGIEATRASFESAFRGLFETGPLLNPQVTATAVTNNGSRRDVALTGAVNWYLGSDNASGPYLTMGGGLIAGTGEAPSAALDGLYSFSVLGLVPIAERDRLTIRFEHETVPTGVVGGGVRRALSGRWRLAIDGRVFIARSGTGVRLDASPEVTIQTPPDFIESFTTPSIQFSNNPSTGRQSSLSGPAVQGLSVFKGNGIQTRVLVTIGVFTRF